MTLDVLIGHRFLSDQLLIKIDAEGAEFDILKHSSHLHERVPKPIWIIENSISRNYGASKNPNYKSLFDQFWSRGYQAYSIDSEPMTLVDSAKRDRWFEAGYCPTGVNYLFRAKKEQ